MSSERSSIAQFVRNFEFCTSIGFTIQINDRDFTGTHLGSFWVHRARIQADLTRLYPAGCANFEVALLATEKRLAFEIKIL